MKIYGISDMHMDYEQNRNLILGLKDMSLKDDVILVAGDISNNISILLETLGFLRSLSRAVFFVPGNHDIWINGDFPDSLAKFNHIIRWCRKNSIDVAPRVIDGILFAPLYSWYSSSFTDEKDIDMPRSWADLHRCKWPGTSQESLEQVFDRMNIVLENPANLPVVSLSHFLPRPELLPARQFLRFKELGAVSGSRLLGKRVKEIKSKVHVFGHTHINGEFVIDGTIFIQNSLKYPHEQIGNRANLLRRIRIPQMSGSQNLKKIRQIQ